MCHCDAQEIQLTAAHAHANRPHVGTDASAEQSHVGTDASAERSAAEPYAHADRPHVGTDASAVQPHATATMSAERRAAQANVSANRTHVGANTSAERFEAGDGVEKAEGAGAKAVSRRRATQETPPAVRREVFLRDHGRCIVPGCRNATYVDLHHLELRSEGGADDPDNLVVVCGAHHGLLHRGRLRIEGKVSTGVRVRHAEGSDYGRTPSPALAEASARTFAALRNLGFSEKAARAALQRALSAASADVTTEALLRSALSSTVSEGIGAKTRRGRA